MAKQKPEEVNETPAENLSVGNVDAATLDAFQFDEVNPLQGLDAAYSAGQPGFEKGVTKLGIFKGTKLCVSTKEKKPRWKIHPNAELAKAGKVCKKLHLFEAVDSKGQKTKGTYGLWHTGALTAMLERVKRDQLVAITYEGQAAEPYRKGDTPPHVFKLRGKGLEMKMTDLTDIEDDNDDAPLSPEDSARLEATRQKFNAGGQSASDVH
jgi:hypothetical protein